MKSLCHFIAPGGLGGLLKALKLEDLDSGDLLLLLIVLLLQPYILGPLSERLLGERIDIAWPWWCPVGGAVSFAVCCLGKKNTKNTTVS